MLASMTKLPELLDKPQVCRRLRISLRKLDYDLHAGVIPHIKLGRTVRFVPDDIERLINSRRIGGSKLNLHKDVMT